MGSSDAVQLVRLMFPFGFWNFDVAPGWTEAGLWGRGTCVVLFTGTCLKTGMSNCSGSNFQREGGEPSVTSSERYGAFLVIP